MLALSTAFWISVLFFGTIGMLRGWTKEIIATSGLVLALFFQIWFGQFLVAIFVRDPADLSDLWRTQFFIRSAVTMAFAFFSFQGPTLVSQVSRGRFGERARGTIQEALLGLFVGCLNGYLLVGSIWSFLEYNIIDKVPVRYPLELPYPFPPEMITRPVSGPAMTLIPLLPVPLLYSWLPLLVVILFLFVIIAMI